MRQNNFLNIRCFVSEPLFYLKLKTLAVFLQRRGITNWVYKAYIKLDSGQPYGHPCYGQLTAVKKVFADQS